MKHIIIFFITILAFSCDSTKQTTSSTEETTRVAQAEIPVEKQSIYQFKVEDISGNEFDFNSLKGKKVIIVNTASKCGLTPQYEGLQNLYDAHKDEGLVIIGFPANNFMMQEPGDNEKIKTFCESKFGVTFPMMSKISVKGKDMHPVYQFLTQKTQNGVEDSKVGWNFQKYLIDENGFLVKHLSPKVKPDSVEMMDWVKG